MTILTLVLTFVLSFSLALFLLFFLLISYRPLLDYDLIKDNGLDIPKISGTFKTKEGSLQNFTSVFISVCINAYGLFIVIK